jgi:hypothetical protein
MTEYGDFESVFHNELDEGTWARIGKRIVSMRREVERKKKIE